MIIFLVVISALTLVTLVSFFGWKALVLWLLMSFVCGVLTGMILKWVENKAK